jgi:hypothetical protein
MDLGKLIQAIVDSLAALFGKPKTQPNPPQPTGQIPDPVSLNVLLVIYNPPIPSHQNKKLTTVLGWNDPDTLVASFINDIRDCSHGYANYRIVERIEVDHLPIKEDGFTYTPEGYLHCWQAGTGFHDPDTANYLQILSDFNIVSRINARTVDEVWLMGFPYVGFRESRMAGPGAFFCNGEVIENIPTTRRFIVMGFSYQRGVGEMFESFAHRAESILDQVFRSSSGSSNLWKRFSRYHLNSPGMAEVGTVHYSPNSQTDYDWGNMTYVPSRCNNWKTFPDLSGVPVMVNCSEWGGGDIRLHHMWWLNHFPHITGEADGIAYNWWKFVVDPNQVN